MESYCYSIQEQIEKISFLERKLKDTESALTATKNELNNIKSKLDDTQDLLHQTESALKTANETSHGLRMDVFTLCVFIGAFFGCFLFLKIAFESPINGFGEILELVFLAILSVPLFALPCIAAAFLLSVVISSFLENGYHYQCHFLNCRFYSRYRNCIFCAIVSTAIAAFFAYLAAR